MLEIVYEYENELEWENGEYDYVRICGMDEFQTYSETTISLIENYLPVIFAALPEETEPEVELKILELFDVRLVLVYENRIWSILWDLPSFLTSCQQQWT